MVVYNHYAPIGQFGQVGLSFMGTTCIPSGKQPDWKHNPSSSSMGIGEGGMNSINMVSTQHNPPPNMPSPIQHHHVAPRSPILSMASPLAMFDVSPFQLAPDMSVQARWSNVPASPPLYSVPLSLPMQQAAEVLLPSPFSHGYHVEQSLAPPHRFSEPQSSTPSDEVAKANVTQFSNELGLADASSSTLTGTLTRVVAANQSSLGSTTANAGKTDAVESGNSDNNNGQSMNNNAYKNQQKNTSGHQYNNHSTGYGHQRGGGGWLKIVIHRVNGPTTEEWGSMEGTNLWEQKRICPI